MFPEQGLNFPSLDPISGNMLRRWKSKNLNQNKVGTDIHGKTIRVVTKVSKIKRMLGGWGWPLRWGADWSLCACEYSWRPRASQPTACMEADLLPFVCCLPFWDFSPLHLHFFTLCYVPFWDFSLLHLHFTFVLLLPHICRGRRNIY